MGDKKIGILEYPLPMGSRMFYFRFTEEVLDHIGISTTKGF